MVASHAYQGINLLFSMDYFNENSLAHVFLRDKNFFVMERNSIHPRLSLVIFPWEKLSCISRLPDENFRRRVHRNPRRSYLLLNAAIFVAAVY